MHKNRIALKIALKAVFWQAKTLAKPYAARVFVVCGKQDLNSTRLYILDQFYHMM